MKNTFDRCTKCVLSADFPKINFDDNGVCNFCRNEIYFTTENKIIKESKRKIANLIDSAKGKSDYDAIMCYSGGKDSTFSLLIAVRKYGLKVLSFTLDNGFISPVALENINRVVDYLGVDQYTVRPSTIFFKSIIKASALNSIYNLKTLARISSVCNACISLVNITALKLALEKKIPLILAGFTLGQIPTNSIVYKNNYNFFQESREIALNKLRKQVGNSVDDYFCIKDSILKPTEAFPHNLNLLCIEDLSEEEIYDEIKSIGWNSPDDVDGCSSNCQLNSFNNLVHQKTFKYSPYELELSHLIRRGKLTREQALKKINDQIDKNILKSIMNRLEIKENDLENLSNIYK